MRKGLLIVVSAPSGCGKGTVLSKVRERHEFFYSVSATTRPPRPEDTEGKTYFFLTEEEFRSKIDNGSMLEYAEYNGNFYGTPMEPVMAHLDKGEDVVLEIEVKGAMQVKSKMPEAEMIFILPPSIDTLRQRLIKRGTESLDVIEERVAKAAEEISRAPEYDHVIVNDVLEDAVDDIIKVIDAKEMTAVRCHDMIKKILDQGDDRT